jgi:hypothetical protein
MKYMAYYLRRLLAELETRHSELARAISPRGERGEEGVEISGLDVRLAVDGLKPILSEIRKLK